MSGALFINSCPVNHAGSPEKGHASSIGISLFLTELNDQDYLVFLL